MSVRPGKIFNCSCRCALAITVLWGLGWTIANGEDAPPGSALRSARVQYHLNIASQPLEGALQEFARQSSLQVVFLSELTDGLTAPALNGLYTLNSAMSMLFAGAHLEYRLINSKTVEIRSPSGAPASSDMVAGHESTPAEHPGESSDRKSNISRPRSAITDILDEVLVVSAAENLVATRTTTPLREIPQTISILSHEQLRQQHDTDLADALNHATGITLVRRDSLDQDFYSRGFPITSFHIDGGAALTHLLTSTVPYLGTPDLTEFDHIEVLRGADALFGGDGNPGATVSMVHKRPRDTYALTVDASLGSWNRKQLELDVTGPLALDGALRARFDTSYLDRNYFYDIADQERHTAFAAIEYDVTADTLLTVGSSYQESTATAVGSGLPIYADGRMPNLSRDTAFAFDAARHHLRQQNAYLQLRQQFGNGWILKLNTSAITGAVTYAVDRFDSPIDPLNNGLRNPVFLFASTHPNRFEQFAGDLTLTGTFSWFGRRAEIALGTDLSRVKMKSQWADFLLPPLQNIYAFDPANYVDPRANEAADLVQEGRSTWKRSGTFGSLRTYLNEHLSVIAGLRVSNDHYHSFDSVAGRTFSLSGTADFSNAHVLSPYAGATYDIDHSHSIYASYADIPLDVGLYQREDGSRVGQIHGVNIETGYKASWFDGSLNGSVAVYRIDQSDWPVFDTDASAHPELRACCYRAVSITSEGIDSEISGLLTQDWLFRAGYTFNVYHGGAIGVSTQHTPRHLFKLWTNVRLPGIMQRWTIGGGLHAQSSNSQQGMYCPQNLFGFCAQSALYTVKQNAYATVDLRTSFQIDREWDVALTVNNVLDHRYYEAIGTGGQNNWYGEPRAFIVSIEGRY
jgi:outer membrane receptor for ferric coprogen and ferric-rhodotorulic acid